MYRDHFGLHGKPFSIAPDPRFLYMSQRHREALAHLLYGIGEGGGFVQLTGEVGTGKTTVCRCLLEQLPDNVDVAFILNPKLTAIELVASICDELGVDYPRGTTSIKTLIDALNEHLLATHAEGRRTVLIIDEAQNLSAEVLEQIRLLTNLETAKDKLLQIILIGQPELGELLGLHEMRQLAQRITARYHLESLSREETRDYVHHRLKVCGGSIQLFTLQSVAEIHRLSEGVPRLINILCDRALLGAYVENRTNVDKKTLRRAAAEVKGEPATGPARRRRRVAAGSVAGLLVVGGLVWLMAGGYWKPGEQPEISVAAQEATETTTATADETPVPGVEPAVPTGQTPSLSGVVEQPAAAPVLGEWLAGVPAAARTEADGALLKRWGVMEKSSSGDLCSKAAGHGLRCLRGKGSWSSLRSLDRPAIIELTTSDGGTAPVALLTLDGTSAEIMLNGVVQKTSLAELDRHWKGDYLVLWRPPVAANALRIGDTGTDVVWLRERLTRILGPGAVANVENPEHFDGVLRQLVRRFQGIRGLQRDGVAGKRTLLHINTVTPGNQSPRLRPVRG